MRQRRAHRVRGLWAGALACFAIGWTCAAQTDPGPASGAPPVQTTAPPKDGSKQKLDKDTIQKLHDRAVELYQDGKIEDALGVWVAILQDNPGDTTALYNSACAVLKLGYKDQAFELLDAAIKAGFVNFEQLKRDPDLAPLRGDERFKKLLASVETMYRDAAVFMQQWARQVLGADAIIEQNDEFRIVYATNLARDTFDRMKKTLEAQMRMQIDSFFGGPPSSYVLLMVPSPQTADELIGSVTVGGFYDHDTRRLVMRDIGPSLRHEITHALHHAQMDRLDQAHPMWIQEGLASMFEMYELDESGHYRVLDNTRINIAINLQHAAALTGWRDFFSEDDRKFNKVRARAKYAQARAIFQFLAENGKLEEWYKAYTEHFQEDATGALAFEKVFGTDLDTTEREWRMWLNGKAKVHEKVPASQAALGVWVTDQAANDGVLIAGLHPGGAGRHDGLKLRDVITAIDGRPVYVVEEVVLEVLKHKAGDTVKVSVRRGKLNVDVDVTLEPVREDRRRPVLSEPGVAA